MERERKFKIVALVAVIIAVIGLSIAFAAMSRTLNINGRGSVDPANFDIYFTNLSQPTLKGEASVSGTPTLATKGVTISNMNVTLKKPNDSVVYTVDIKNDGDIDAEIENLVLPTFTNAQQELFDFTVVYTNGGQAVSIGDTLAKGETRNVTITFKYKDITDESLLPSTAQQISLSYQIIYKQTNKEVLASGSSGHNSGGNSSIGAFTRTWNLDNGFTLTYTSNTPTQDGGYTNGTATISGTGVIPAPGENEASGITLALLDAESMEQVMESPETYFDMESGKAKYKYQVTDLTIEPGVTGISDGAIGTDAKNLYLPTSLTNLNEGALGGMNDLTNVYITAPSVNIAAHAFEGCYSLQNIYISSTSVTSVGSSYDSILSSTIYCKNQSAADDILAVMASAGGNYPTVTVDASKFN